MTTLGTELLEGSVRLWAASADNLTDAAVFLVTASDGTFCRVCSMADMENYPAERYEHIGWYRASGVAIPYGDSHDVLDCVTALRGAVTALDTAMGDVGSGVAETLHDIRYYRTGDVVGSLRVSSEVLGTVTRATITIDLGTAVWTPEFEFTDDDFVEFLGVTTPFSDESSDVVVADALEVVMDTPLFGHFIAALLDDICDSVTYYALIEGALTPGET